MLQLFELVDLLGDLAMALDVLFVVPATRLALVARALFMS